MRAAVPLRKELPSTVTHCFFFFSVALLVMQGAYQASIVRYSVSSDVMGLSSSAMIP